VIVFKRDAQFDGLPDGEREAARKEIIAGVIQNRLVAFGEYRIDECHVAVVIVVGDHADSDWGDAHQIASAAMRIYESPTS
jgi:hypothetical protein